MTDRTIPPDEWKAYPNGLRVLVNDPQAKGRSMEDPPFINLVYITLPEPSEPVLNLHMGDNFVKFRVTTDQLLNLNADIADALIRGKQRRQLSGPQLVLALEQ